MSRSSVFKIFCFLTALLLFTNIVSDLRLTETPYFRIIMQFGLMVFLVDLGLHTNMQSEKENTNPNTTTLNYQFLASKLGLSTMFIGFLIQTFTI